jgi:hypothetical protein
MTTASRFRGAGTSAPGCSHDWRAARLRCISTDAISVSFTSSWMGSTLGKRTALNFWEAAEVGWEAKAMRKHDELMAKQAREQGQQTRARIQSEAGRARKRRSSEIRQDEHSRQWDRQREEIHPAEVLERLASVKPKKAAPPKLPPAVPDADPDRPVRSLPVRTIREEPLS